MPFVDEEETYYFRIEGLGEIHYLYLEKWFREKFCPENNLELVYLRKLKTGHIPQVREVKVKGPKSACRKIRAYIEETDMYEYLDHAYNYIREVGYE